MTLAKQVIERYSKLGLMITTAESCTGGMIAAALTDIPGSSAVVDRGFVTYTNDAKMDMLGVRVETLETYGAVSEETAREMAQGALAHSKADVSVAVTGIAGPGGGTIEKPVGLIYMALAKSGDVKIHKLLLGEEKSRDEIRQATVMRALEELLMLTSDN